MRKNGSYDLMTDTSFRARKRKTEVKSEKLLVVLILDMLQIAIRE